MACGVCRQDGLNRAATPGRLPDEISGTKTLHFETGYCGIFVAARARAHLSINWPMPPPLPRSDGGRRAFSSAICSRARTARTHATAFARAAMLAFFSSVLHANHEAHASVVMHADQSMVAAHTRTNNIHIVSSAHTSTHTQMQSQSNCSTARMCTLHVPAAAAAVCIECAGAFMLSSQHHAVGAARAHAACSRLQPPHAARIAVAASPEGGRRRPQHAVACGLEYIIIKVQSRRPFDNNYRMGKCKQ